MGGATGTCAVVVAAVGVGVVLVDVTADEPRAGDLVPRGPAATDRLADALRARLEQDVDACVQALGDYSGSAT